MNEIFSFFSLPPHLPFPEDLPLLWDYALQQNPKNPTEVFDFLHLELFSSVGQSLKKGYSNLIFPPEFFPIAFHRTKPLIWGYIVDDPSQNFPVYIATYSPTTGRGEVLSTHHILSALLDWVNDHIEDIEEGMAPSHPIEQLYHTAETLLRVYAQVPKNNKGFVTRNHLSIAQPEDGLGLVVPLLSLGISTREEFFKKYPILSEIEATKNAIQEALRQKLPGLALFYGRNLWYHTRQNQEEFECAKKLLVEVYQTLERPFLAQKVLSQPFSE